MKKKYALEMNREDLLARLRDLDEYAYLAFSDNAERLHLILVGGSALVLLKVITRSTSDMDALSVSSCISNVLEDYDINTRVAAHADNFPLNIEQRLVRIEEIQGKMIDFYTASVEDIVISKLCAGRDKDIDDITTPDVLECIDWELLETLALNDDELKATILNERRYSEFLDAYHNFVKEHKP